MERTIFAVGRPDFGAGAVERIHRRGYKAGIFIDRYLLNTTRLDEFDVVIPLDFEQLDIELARLKEYRGKVAGLLCTYENYLLAKSKLGTFFDVPALSLKSAKLSTDKLLMRAAFQQHDTSITPAFQEIGNVDEAQRFANQHDFPVITKPANLVKSLFVSRSDNLSELTGHVSGTLHKIAAFYKSQHVYERTPRLLIEEYMSGEQYSVAAYVDATGNIYFCPGVTKLITASDRGHKDNYLYQRELPTRLAPGEENDFFDVARKGIEALGLTASPAHVELMKTKDGIKIIEIGARTGGYRPRMYEISYGIDLIDTEISIALGEAPQLSGKLENFVAVFELFSETSGNFYQITGASDKIKKASTYFSIKPTIGSKIGPAKDGFRATAVVIISDSDEQRFQEKIQAIDRLTVEIR